LILILLVYSWDLNHYGVIIVIFGYNTFALLSFSFDFQHQSLLKQIAIDYEKNIHAS